VKPPTRIQRTVLSEIADRGRREASRECCGLLAGRGGIITQAFPAENVAANPTTGYEIAPKEIFQMMREFRAAGLEFLGIYHSHPKGDNAPSTRDIEQAYYSEEVYLIISPQPDVPKPVRAFSIRDGRATELEIEIV
jgi:proteasome lid subunit RPN8/RPN11